MKGRSARLLLLATSVLVALVVAELGYRAALLSDGERFRKLKDPALYADYFSEDLHWKLHLLLDGESKPPRRPHPVLGWVGKFSRADLRHRDSARLAGRRPVLLYGDSFAECAGDVACFEDILNRDREFSEENYLLNYGVGGYGVDQSLLLLRNTVELFDDPFVVFSLFPYDLARSALSIRIGQKPRFEVVDGALELEPTPIYESAEAFVADHPPRAVSYLYRRAVFSDLLPAWLSRTLRREAWQRQRKIEVSEGILSATLGELRRRDLGFVFLVFHGERPSDNPLFGGSDWREEFLRRWLEGNGVPYIWSKDVVAGDRGSRGSRSSREWGSATPARYIDPESSHPTEHFNRIVAREIRRRVLASGKSGAGRDRP
ncbi:MAG: hypothetical protein GY769_18425 [bacterium]|nr:hypothetical protein [bacterium]